MARCDVGQTRGLLRTNSCAMRVMHRREVVLPPASESLEVMTSSFEQCRHRSSAWLCQHNTHCRCRCRCRCRSRKNGRTLYSCPQAHDSIWLLRASMYHWLALVMVQSPPGWEGDLWNVHPGPTTVNVYISSTPSRAYQGKLYGCR